MRNKKAQSTIFILVTVMIVIIMILCAVIMITGIPIETTRGGTHTGYVTAVEENGMIWHTYRVYFKTDAQSSQEDSYCLTDTNLIETLKNVEEDKQKVTITYNSYFMNGISHCGFDTVAIITGVK